MNNFKQNLYIYKATAGDQQYLLMYQFSCGVRCVFALALAGDRPTGARAADAAAVNYSDGGCAAVQLHIRFTYLPYVCT